MVGKEICKVEGCERPVHCWGYCNKHRQQFKRFGYIPERTERMPNEIIDYGGYLGVVIYSRRGGRKYEALIDKEQGHRVVKHKWCLSGKGYAITKSSGNTIRMHNFVTECYDLLDHKNMNKLDNRKENLRRCTPAQNNMNKNPRRDSNSGVTGVSWVSSNKKWKAAITVDGKDIYLGLYELFDDAVKVRRQAEKKYFREFAPKRKDHAIRRKSV